MGTCFEVERAVFNDLISQIKVERFMLIQSFSVYFCSYLFIASYLMIQSVAQLTWNVKCRRGHWFGEKSPRLGVKRSTWLEALCATQP